MINKYGQDSVLAMAGGPSGIGQGRGAEGESRPEGGGSRRPQNGTLSFGRVRQKSQSARSGGHPVRRVAPLPRIYTELRQRRCPLGGATGGNLAARQRLVGVLDLSLFPRLSEQLCRSVVTSLAADRFRGRWRLPSVVAVLTTRLCLALANHYHHYSSTAFTGVRPPRFLLDLVPSSRNRHSPL